ncbi:phospholipase D-like domain-containing anti-phage protein [Pyxidicoccus sp. 3LFB2]
MIHRFSSRQGRLDHLFLREKLRGAKRYLRIAGYFRSSLFELIHEELEGIDEIRIVCNSDLDPRDISAARSEHERAMALKEKWNERPPEADSILGRDRYRKLHSLLVRGNLKIRVVSRQTHAFLHGKAGLVEQHNGARTAFMGSNNETREGWKEHYELLWSDESKDACTWVEEEFEYLWGQGVPLSQAIIDEVERCAHRVEFRAPEDCPPERLPAAAMAESPIYRRGEALMPWQQAFVGMFLEHRNTYGKARMLLADEVGVGKTLSLASAALLSSLLGDGPALILCPATLTLQWQVEFWDKLGVPSAVWTNKDTWLDHTGHHIRTNGAADVARCPYQIGIVSTGLVFHGADECAHLLERNYGTLVLDEAHRARRSSGFGSNAGEPNNLLAFMLKAAQRSKNVLLGTATPVQTDVKELWDLFEILNQSADFVLGRPSNSIWRDPERVLGLMTGKKCLDDEAEAWNLIRNPLPPRREDNLFDYVRSDLSIGDDKHFTSKSAVDLTDDTRQILLERVSEPSMGLEFFQRHNPVVRHTVLRKRTTLEARGLLPRIAVDIHPNEWTTAAFFDGQGLQTTMPIDKAYAAAAEFCRLVGQRTNSTGFLKSLMLQRICSSLASGLSTAEKLLARGTLEDGEELEDVPALSHLTEKEKEALETVVEHLRERPEDPKLAAVRWHLREKGWLHLGCIVFSQYYDTARWVAESLTKSFDEEPVALYAGADRSGILRDGDWVRVERDAIKDAVRKRELRLVVATDAACEGLNLQTLGTLINVDLPWNPSRLEQRIGRIKRFGQSRSSVDMLNLVYHGTLDERVYERLSARMKDRYDLFGSLPDVIDDEWIDDIESLDERLSERIDKRRQANAFDLRCNDTVNPSSERWEKCSEVLSRKDLVERMSRGW